MDLKKSNKNLDIKLDNLNNEIKLLKLLIEKSAYTEIIDYPEYICYGSLENLIESSSQIWGD